MGSVIVDQRNQAKIVLPADATIARTVKQRNHECGNRALDGDVIASGGLVNIECFHAFGKNQFSPAFQYRVEQPLFGREIIVCQRGIDVGQGRHLAHRHAIKTTFRKQVFCSIKDPVRRDDTSVHFARSTHGRPLRLWSQLRHTTTRRSCCFAAVTSDFHVRSSMASQAPMTQSRYSNHALLNLNFSHSNSFQLHS